MSKSNNSENVSKFKCLESILGYSFKDISLLELALTHSSLNVGQNNERLEFLGDRVLGLVIAEVVFTQFPDDKEGLLAKRFTALVRQESLAKVASEIQLGESIMMSSGEANSGGREKASILSDVMESVLAAVFLDGGFEAAKVLVAKFWQPLVNNVDLQDAKSSLQEWLQSHKKALPIYTLLDTEGDRHERTFIVKVTADNDEEAEGRGTSKQQAEQEAASELLEKLLKRQ